MVVRSVFILWPIVCLWVLFVVDFDSRAFELLNSKKVKFQKFLNSGLAHKSWKITSNSVAGNCLSLNHQSRGVSDTFLIVQKFSRPVFVRFSSVQIFQTLELAKLEFFKNHMTRETKNRTKYECFSTSNQGYIVGDTQMEREVRKFEKNCKD